MILTTTKPYTEVPGSAAWIPFDINPAFEIQPGEKYTFCFKLKEVEGEYGYYYYYESSDVWDKGEGGRRTCPMETGCIREILGCVSRY